MATRAKRNAADVIASAALPERSVQLCLRGDLLAALQDLQRQLTDAEREDKAGGSLDGGAAREVAEQIQTLREEMLDHTITVTIRALPRKKFRTMVVEHPPREDNEGDRVLGFNPDTFFDALMRVCAVEPVLDEALWADLEDKLSDGQWQTLTNAAWAVNERDLSVPFSQRASQILASSAPE